MGCNLLKIFGYNFARYLTSHTNRQQLITLSRTVQSKDYTAISRMLFAPAPLRQHGPRSYPLYSSDSESSRGKTLVFPQLRQFSVPKLSCQMNFCKMMNFQLMLLSTFFLKPCMFLLLLCLSTILAQTCPASCQPSCSPTSSSGSVGAASFHTFSCSMTAPTWFCAAAPPPSPSESGSWTRWSPSVALRPARQQMPRLAARHAAADCRAHAQAILLQPSGSCFQTRWSLHLLLLQPCLKTVLEPFSYPARRFLHAWDQWRLHRLHRRGTCPMNGYSPRGLTTDLFSFQPRPELRGSPVESWLHPW